MIPRALHMPDLSAEPYEPRGIFNSEMAFLLGTIARLKINVVIESGRARGQSTYLLAKYLPETVRIYSVERFRDDDALFCEERIGARPNVALLYSDGRTMVPRLVEWNKGAKIAVLLDGPKGQTALDLIDAIRNEIVVAFIHDMRKLDDGKTAPFRAEAERMFPEAFFTDDEGFIEATKAQDEPVFALGAASNWTPYHIGGEFIGSYGPTLGMFPCSMANTC